MNVQVLVATMKRNDYSLLEKMNIQTDAIVGNQCDRNEITEFLYNNRNIKWLSFKEKGVGLNRNNTLMRSTGDIILFADDDVVYDDSYEEKIIRFYETHPDADVVIFNFKIRRGDGAFCDRVTKEGKIGKRAATKYGTYCISAKKDKIRFANVMFHLDFGGGTKFSHGEDSIFLQDCFRKKLNVYTSKTLIGTVDHGTSTWFNGYSDKFFSDKGVLFSLLFPNLPEVFALVHCYKKRKKYKNYGWINAYKQMKNGIRMGKRDL